MRSWASWKPPTPTQKKGGIRWIREREEGVKEMVIIDDVDFTI